MRVFFAFVLILDTFFEIVPRGTINSIPPPLFACKERGPGGEAQRETLVYMNITHLSESRFIGIKGLHGFRAQQTKMPSKPNFHSYAYLLFHVEQ